jgi:type VI protein secretion system component VasK
VGAADRPRSWGRKVAGNPWLAVGIVIGVLLICAWIAWTVHVWSDNGARQGLGVLIVWPAIVAVLAVISIPFVWAFRVIRASAGGDQETPEAEPGSADAETPEAEATEAG